MKADLHIHSKYSDGSHTVKELAEIALKNEIDIIAITDHDTIGVKPEEIINLPVRVLIGVELSTIYNGENVHLLGYFPNNDVKKPKLLEYLNLVNEERKHRVKEIIKKLRDNFNIEITYEDVKKFADGTIGRPHIAKAIMEKYPYEFDKIFELFIGDGKKAYVKAYDLAFNEGVKMLHNYGALAVIAHPGLLKRTNVTDLIACGVDGIEVYSPVHNKAQTKRFYKLAQQNNLLITGGSDYHDDQITKPIGYSHVNDAETNLFLQKI